MYRLAVVVLFAIGCNASGYSGSVAQLSSGASYGGQTLSQPLPYAVQGYGSAPAYDAAIQTRRTVELRPVATQQDYSQPQIIEVNPDHVPVQVHFKTGSSRVNVHQSHTPGSPPQVEHASFQDEPHRVVHEVVKPVIQEVREIIQPYRRVTQEIRPVIEEVHTVVHKGEGRRGQQQYNGGGGGYGGQQQFSGGLTHNQGYKAGAKAKGRA
ncbi:uncharacterized protein LOC128957933 [Oppia nitens]|uniref:uncharacterized protein LOC128957933 n=1 Tax=Oppia nitens TaxID=1686743 RepID=UPI0023DBD60E|nr:uncharacterized protein LOC128957933 [Oppia nitens]